MKRTFIYIGFIVLGSFAALSGCRVGHTDKPVWVDVNIADLAPPDKPALRLLKTIDFNILVYEIPIDHITQIRELWRGINTQSIQFKNAFAFHSNAFRIGLTQRLNWVQGTLESAGAILAHEHKIIFGSVPENDLDIRMIDHHQSLHFCNYERRYQYINIAPSKLVLRLKCGPIPNMPETCQLLGYPVITSNISYSIPELAERARARDIAFNTTAFKCYLRIGDILVLGPEEYYGDESSLGGLFFKTPQGTLFLEDPQGDQPQQKPSLRVYVMVCTSIQL